MPIITIEAIICAIFEGCLARYLKLYIKKIEKNKKRMIIFLVFSVVSYIAVLIFNIIPPADIGDLIYDLVLPVLVFGLMYAFTAGNTEKYNMSKKMKKIPEVRKAGILYTGFLAFYLVLPFAALGVYIFISGKDSFYVSEDNLDSFIFCFLAYFVVFFASFHFYGIIIEKCKKAGMKKESEEPSKENINIMG